MAGQQRRQALVRYLDTDANKALGTWKVSGKISLVGPSGGFEAKWSLTNIVSLHHLHRRRLYVAFAHSCDLFGGSGNAEMEGVPGIIDRG